MNEKSGLKNFTYGAEWMFNELNSGRLKTFDRNINYNAYGIFKYGLSFIAFGISFLLLFKINLLLIPVSIFVFYIIEVHFLFLFPILVDGVRNPIKTSILVTYRIGFFRALTTVIPIGIYMIAGLVNLNNPLRHWYIGCLAIIIWYQDEVRAKI